MKRHQDVRLHLVSFCTVQASTLSWLFLPRMLCLLSVRYILYIMVSWYMDNRLCRLSLLQVCCKSYIFSLYSRFRRLLKQEGQSSCRTVMMKSCVLNAPEAQLVELVTYVQRFCPQDSSLTCSHLLQIIQFPVIFQAILSLKSSQKKNANVCQ